MNINGWRKYSAVMLALVLGFVLELLGKCDGNFTTIVTVCVGAYMAAHGVADWGTAKAWMARGKQP